MQVFVCCVQLCSVQQRLGELGTAAEQGR
jgi:hypothetical protein